jgi:predicted O-methyltransferase YrrM
MNQPLTVLGYHDRMSPFQHEQRKLFQGSTADFVPALYAALTNSASLCTPCEALKLEHTPLHSIEEMASAPLNLRLLQFLIKLTGAQSVLEVGAFVGVSAIYMARALPEGGSVTTIEKFDHFAEICRRNLQNNGVFDRVRLLQGDAIAVLDTLAGEEFDFAVIDGDKGRYPEYFMKIDKLLAPGGLVLVDDAFFHGDALNSAPTTDKGAGVKKFLGDMATRTEYERIALPIANGVFLARKQ